MPQFKNISKRLVSIIHQGRKLNIPPGQIVDGPDMFKMYKDLKKVDEKEVERYKKAIEDVRKYNPQEYKKIYYTDNITSQTVVTDVNTRNPLQYNVIQVNNVKKFLNSFEADKIPSVAICLYGSDNTIKNSIEEKVKYKNYKIYDNYNNEMKLEEDFILVHSSDKKIQNDYVSEVVKLGVISNVNIPKIYEVEELDKNWIRKDVIEKYIEKKECYISIVTLVNNLRQYNNFLDDLSNQYTINKMEIIIAPNFSNIYSSCSEALNMLKDVSSGEIINFCHQDLKCNTTWIHGIITHVKQLNARNIKWGVLGIAGAYLQNNPRNEYNVLYLGDGINFPNYAASYRRLYGNKKEVQCVDELALIMRRTDDIRFDEINFDHYHFYGSDICLQYLSEGYTNFAIDACCIHLSDGQTNMYKHRDEYIESAVRLYKKWRKTFNCWKTTTANFDVDKKVIIPLIFLIINQKNRNKDFPQCISIRD